MPFPRQGCPKIAQDKARPFERGNPQAHATEAATVDIVGIGVDDSGALAGWVLIHLVKKGLSLAAGERPGSGTPGRWRWIVNGGATPTLPAGGLLGLLRCSVNRRSDDLAPVGLSLGDDPLCHLRFHVNGYHSHGGQPSGLGVWAVEKRRHGWNGALRGTS